MPGAASRLSAARVLPACVHVAPRQRSWAAHQRGCNAAPCLTVAPSFNRLNFDATFAQHEMGVRSQGHAPVTLQEGIN